MYLPQKFTHSVTRGLLNTSIDGLRRLGLLKEQDPEELSPIFVLSTGRCGTQTLAALLGASSDLLAVHEPRPSLYGCSASAYAMGLSAAQPYSALVQETRDPLLTAAVRLGKRYAETSPQMTFLAPGLQILYPKARFIHLTRDAEAVICSGLGRNWYQGADADSTRIYPRAGSEAACAWAGWAPETKLAWLWDETNAWIEESLTDCQYRRIKAESIFAGETELEDLFAWLDVSKPRKNKSAAILARKLNASHNTAECSLPQDAVQLISSRMDAYGYHRST